MSTKWGAVAACALGVVAIAQAENVITVWESSGTYNVYQEPERRVELTSDGVFKLQATGDHDGLGEIRSIAVASSVTGTVEVYILRRPEEGGGPGAYDVRLLNLSGDATAIIRECRVAHDLAADGNVVADTLGGDLVVGSAIGHDIALDHLDGHIECITMHNLSVTTSSSPDAAVKVTEPYAGTMYVNGPLGALDLGAITGTVVIGDDLEKCRLTYSLAATGVLEIGGDLWGRMETMVAGIAGRLIVHGNLSGVVIVGSWVQANMTGSIVVDHDLTGRISVSGNLVDDTESAGAGHIIINGSLGSGVGVAHIDVAGRFGGRQAFIAVDYDGDQTEDGWKPDAFVDVASIRLTGNTPAEQVWEISSCRGDMNGDWAVDFGDINAFILGLSNPEGYSQTFPGLGCTDDPNDPECLGGSRIWHGDINCDGAFNFADINPFVALLALPEPCCDRDCPLCDTNGGQEMMGAQELADGLAAHVWPELHADLVALIVTAVDNAANEAEAEYWLAVYDALTE